MANLYTKTGDKGQTGLVGGSRVSKASPRVSCYGTIDEANSMLGLAYSLTENPYIRETVHKIQGKLFALGAELASDEEGLKKLKGKTLTQQDVDFLESVVDTCTETTGIQTAFVIPGVNRASATFHVARTIVRRAERNMIAARETENLRDLLFVYVNRLSDTVYALARLEETLTQKEELKEKIKDIVRQKLAGGGEQTRPFNLETVKRLAEYAEQKAKEMKIPIVFSAVDDSGNLMLYHRMEDSLVASIDISIDKAYTANALKAPTHQIGEDAKPGGSLYGIQNTNKNRIVIFGGGYPYKFEGKVVGGIGVSGGTAEEDRIIAEYALSEIGGEQ